MANKTSIAITSTTPAGKNVQKNITDINPNSTDSQLVTFGQKVMAFSKNAYVGTKRLDQTDCDTATTKQTPVFTLGGEIDPSILTRSYCLEGHNISFSCTSDGELSIPYNDDTTWCTTIRRAPSDPEGLLRLYIGIIVAQTANNATAPHEIIIKSAETENYYAGEFTITILED